MLGPRLLLTELLGRESAKTTRLCARRSRLLLVALFAVPAPAVSLVFGFRAMLFGALSRNLKQPKSRGRIAPLILLFWKVDFEL